MMHLRNIPEIEDIAAIESLIAEHSYLLDHERWSEMADLYTPDGVLEGGPAPLAGRDEMREWARKRSENRGRRTHHQCTNVRIRFEDDDAAEGTVMLVLHTFDASNPDRGTAIELVGEYRDTYRRLEGQWLFARRRIVPLAAAGSN